MGDRPLSLVQPTAGKIVSFDVALSDALYRGTASLDHTPPTIRRLFECFEEYVNGQVFPLADEVEEEIDALGLRIAFADGSESPAEDLQVYPSTGRVSFRAHRHALNGTAS